MTAPTSDVAFTASVKAAQAIAAWDTNCPQHIPRKINLADAAAALAARDARIMDLEAELSQMHGGRMRSESLVEGG